MFWSDYSRFQYYVWIGTGVALLLAVFSKYIYRLAFHPLAKFPGPKLAAATSLYGAFYDLRPRTSYVKKFSRLHDRYGTPSLIRHREELTEAGPIVRVWPNHLHINDMEAYDQ